MGDFRETLYTVDKSGRRKWVYPAVVRGFFHRARSIVISFLLLFYLSMPWLLIKGKQAILFDLANRKFIFFGTTFWATDSYFLLFILGGLALCLFFFTALLGRVWCGWACPETVFLEFLFRPIEALIEGSPAQRRKLDAEPWSASKIFKKGIKFFIFAALAWLLSSTFLAYFIGREPLIQMMGDYPSNNLQPFLMTLILMGFILFQFGWFREQFCTIVCPYARFQSVLMDPHSLLVGYDTLRGEPRGKKDKTNQSPSKGDCVDCGLCVRVCPTGIDIRNGTQLECIHCASCIDACDSIMEKIGRPSGLIRYDTEHRLRGNTGKATHIRAVLYGSLLTCYAFGFIYFLRERQPSDAQVIRNVGVAPYTKISAQEVSNQFHAHLSNKSEKLQSFTLELLDAPEVHMVVPLNPFPVKAGETGTAPVFFNFAPTILHDGKREVSVHISTEDGFDQTQKITLLGPEHDEQEEAEHEHSERER